LNKLAEQNMLHSLAKKPANDFDLHQVCKGKDGLPVLGLKIKGYGHI
jgi:hypothetical protein